MNKFVHLDGFGSPVSEEARLDDVDLEDVAAIGLQRLGKDTHLNSIEKIYTSTSMDFTHALRNAVKKLDLDIEVEEFYPRGTKPLRISDRDIDQKLVDLCVRFGDAEDNGQTLLRHAKRKGVPALDINLDDLVDKETAYADTLHHSSPV